MATETSGLSFRRYNGVILAHPRLDEDRWRDFFVDFLASLAARELAGHNWLVGEGVFMATPMFLGPSVPYIGARGEAATTPYPLLIARPIGHGIANAQSPAGVTGITFLAAPYVRLLRTILHALESALGQPRPWYMAFNPQVGFQALADVEGKMKATQFSVQVREASSADRVAISGRNPLRADLGKDFARSAIEDDVGFGIRLKVSAYSGFSTNVNADRHGNFWWFHRGRPSLYNLLPSLEQLHDLGILRWTRLCPPDHEDEANKDEANND